MSGPAPANPSSSFPTDRNGRRYNKKLRAIQNEARGLSQERSKVGKRGNAKRWPSNGIVNRNCDSSVIASASQTHRDSDSDSDSDSDIDSDSEKAGGTLSHSEPPVNNSASTQSKPNGKSAGNSHSIESERATTHLARAVANNLEVPDTPANLKSIEHAIKNECLVSRCSELQAAQIIRDHTHPASFGTKPIRFFFEDADWRNDPKYSSKSCNSKEMVGVGNFTGTRV